MELLNFINHNVDWEKKLAAAPYFITTKWDDRHQYFMLSYSQFKSDFSEKFVQQARGSIFYVGQSLFDGLSCIECVCRPFDKFHNYNEPNAADIDWSTAWVTEKIDGSLMKLWYHNYKWHLSTNGTIDAFNAEVGDVGLTFGGIFCRVLNNLIFDFTRNLDVNYTYMFELTSPETQVIIPYDDGIYFLGARHNLTGEYSYFFPPNRGVRFPHYYNLHSLESCIKIADQMEKDEEGFVVCDAEGHRVKIKSAGWLMAHYYANNGVITDKRIFEIIKAGVEDDFISYLPNQAGRVQKLKDLIEQIKTQLTIIYHSLKKNGVERKNVMTVLEASKMTFAADFVFKKMSNNDFGVDKYIDSLEIAKLLKLIENYKGKCD